MDDKYMDVRRFEKSFRILIHSSLLMILAYACMHMLFLTSDQPFSPFGFVWVVYLDLTSILPIFFILVLIFGYFLLKKGSPQTMRVFIQAVAFNIGIFLVLTLSAAIFFVCTMAAGGSGAHPIAGGIGYIGIIVGGIAFLLSVVVPIIALIQEIRGGIFEYPFVKRFIRIGK